MSIAVVIAAYDEELTIEPLTRRLVAALTATGRPWRLIYVVEGDDQTAAIVSRLAAKEQRIELIYRREARGFADAFRAGFAALPASASHVLTMDADLNHQPEQMDRLLATASREDVDIVVGSRFVAGATVSGTPLWKRALSTGMNVFLRHVFRVHVLDKTSGFRVYRASALARILPLATCHGYAVLPELLVAAERAGLRVNEVPIDFIFRQEGSSKMPILGTAGAYCRLLWRMLWAASRESTELRASVGRSSQPLAPEPTAPGSVMRLALVAACLLLTGAGLTATLLDRQTGWLMVDLGTAQPVSTVTALPLDAAIARFALAQQATPAEQRPYRLMLVAPLESGHGEATAAELTLPGRAARPACLCFLSFAAPPGTETPATIGHTIARVSVNGEVAAEWPVQKGDEGRTHQVRIDAKDPLHLRLEVIAFALGPGEAQEPPVGVGFEYLRECKCKE